MMMMMMMIYIYMCAGEYTPVYILHTDKNKNNLKQIQLNVRNF